jgi:hypothetical protein
MPLARRDPLGWAADAAASSGARPVMRAMFDAAFEQVGSRVWMAD